MGSYYARHDGEDPDVAAAVAEHYRPVGPNDRVPTAPISYVVAVADKIDSLVMLWHAGEAPTGSKDPFALRRSGLGIIRIILENKLRLPLKHIMRAVLSADQPAAKAAWEQRVSDSQSSKLLLTAIAEDVLENLRRTASEGDGKTVDELLEFLADRLKVALRERGVRHDLIDAVFSLGGDDDLVRLVNRVNALQQLLKSEDGTNLLAGYKRAANILRIEEKKDGHAQSGEPDPKLLSLPEERTLYELMATGREIISGELERERFVEAMSAMAKLRVPVDAFFDKVTVNVPDAELRANRLKLLGRLRQILHQVADFSKIEG